MQCSRHKIRLYGATAVNRTQVELERKPNTVVTIISTRRLASF